MMVFNSNPENNICTFNTLNLSPPLSLSLSSDDFFVDQLFNFNNDDHLHVQDEPFLVTQTPDSKKLSPFNSPSIDFDPTRVDFGAVLSVPAEEADLEWLSHFVEESFSQFSSPYPDGVGPVNEHSAFKPKPEPEPESRKVDSFSSPRALKSRRSKRARTGGRVWTTALAESSSVSSSTSATSSSSDPSSLDPARRRRREGSLGRKCTHCGVQKTPQWRSGPLGPKSLCNACGVRYKSGRLLPEYRPACSPTFSSELHSNNHRKVLEMRRNKEVKNSGRVGPGLSHPVPSFG